MRIKNGCISLWCNVWLRERAQSIVAIIVVVVSDESCFWSQHQIPREPRIRLFGQKPEDHFFQRIIDLHSVLTKPSLNFTPLICCLGGDGESLREPNGIAQTHLLALLLETGENLQDNPCKHGNVQLKKPREVWRLSAGGEECWARSPRLGLYLKPI